MTSYSGRDMSLSDMAFVATVLFRRVINGRSSHENAYAGQENQFVARSGGTGHSARGGGRALDLADGGDCPRQCLRDGKPVTPGAFEDVKCLREQYEELERARVTLLGINAAVQKAGTKPDA